MTFGAFLNNSRESQGLLVKDIAKRLKVSSSYVSQLEKGATFPSKKQLVSLAKAYEVKEDELLKRWAESKIHRVSLDTEYQFSIGDIGEKKAREITQKIEENLEEFKKTLAVKGSKVEAEFVQIPLLGTVPAGEITEVYPLAEDFIALPKTIIIQNHHIFALKADGISMEQAGIISGDIVIIDQDAQVHNGDIVVAQTPDGVTMKYFQKRKNYVELKPASKEFKTTYKLKEVRIVGRLIYHMKKY